jgi:hypothetical protein
MPSTKIATLLDTWYPSAQRLAVTIFILIALLVVLLCNPADGDDLTGQAQDDPKDLAPTPPPAPCAPTGMMFQEMPAWSRDAVMPPLPDTLKPMGKKVVVNTVPPTPAPLAPPKDAASAPEVTVAKPVATPPPAPAPSPALIAVSPFLQWIQSNPQAASQARQQASAYQAPAPTTPAGNGTSGNAAAPATAATPTGPTDPYWLPPLIDTAPFGGQTGGSSAAIYVTPQR